MMMQRLTPVVRVSEAIAAKLEMRILEGSLKPGDRLASERDLAAEFGVSRPSVREAIHSLVKKGLLSTKHGGGSFVTDRMDAPFVDPWQDMLVGHPGLQDDMLEFRHMLESQAARLAAERATDADLARLDETYAALSEAYLSKDLAASIETDVAFHQAIAEATHNMLIGHLSASLLRVIHGHVSRNLEYLQPRERAWAELQEQHHAIWQAIHRRDPDAAAAAALAHIEYVRMSMAANAIEKERRHSALRRLGEGG
jgi:GntR family transcriptional repressor for pyruvate dehydrogenase complex